MTNGVYTQVDLSGAREAVEFYPNAPHLAQQVTALERALQEESPLAFDLAKSLVECVCRTILEDRGRTFASDMDAPALLHATQAVLPLVPVESDANRDSVRKTLAGLVTSMQGICELRNSDGFSSHGKDAFKRHAAKSQAQLAARAASTIVGFLVSIHRGETAVAGRKRLYFEDYTDFNTHIDGSVGDIQILDYTFAASAILYAMDEGAYGEQLALFNEKPEPDGEE